MASRRFPILGRLVERAYRLPLGRLASELIRAGNGLPELNMT